MNKPQIITGNNIYLGLDFKYADQYRIVDDNKQSQLDPESLINSVSWQHSIPDDNTIIHSLPNSSYGTYRIFVQLRNSASTSSIFELKVTYVDEDAQIEVSEYKGKLFISQVFGNSTTPDGTANGLYCHHQWATIYNGSNESVDLTKVKLVVAYGQGEQEVKEIKLSGTIAPYSHFLIRGMLPTITSTKASHAVPPVMYIGTPEIQAGDTSYPIEINTEAKVFTPDLDLVDSLFIPSKDGVVYLCDESAEYTEDVYNSGRFSEGYIHMIGINGEDSLGALVLAPQYEGEIYKDLGSKHFVYIALDKSDMKFNNLLDILPKKLNNASFDEACYPKVADINGNKPVITNGIGKLKIGQCLGTTSDYNKSQDGLYIDNCFVSLYNKSDEEIDLSSIKLYWTAKDNNRASDDTSTNIYTPWVEVSLSGVINPKSNYCIKGISPVLSRLPESVNITSADWGTNTGQIHVDKDASLINWGAFQTEEGLDDVYAIPKEDVFKELSDNGSLYVSSKSGSILLTNGNSSATIKGTNVSPYGINDYIDLVGISAVKSDGTASAGEENAFGPWCEGTISMLNVDTRELGLGKIIAGSGKSTIHERINENVIQDTDNNFQDFIGIKMKSLATSKEALMALIKTSKNL